MKTYIGTKQVAATPMTRQAYNDYRGWELPKNEDGADDGYLVEYLDGGKPNDSRHAGYISWSPKAQFDAAYRVTTGLPFGLAIEALKKGQKVARSGWNDKGRCLALVAAETVPQESFIGMKTADDMFLPWIASRTDVLADDWQIIE